MDTKIINLNDIDNGVSYIGKTIISTCNICEKKFTQTTKLDMSDKVCLCDECKNKLKKLLYGDKYE